MKNKEEYFIRYYDNQLDEKEKLSFEKKLADDYHLKNDYNRFVKVFGSAKNKIDVDERYFNSLIPTAKKQLIRKNNYLLKFAYVLPVIFIGFLFLLKSSNEKEINTFYDFQNLFEYFTSEEKITDELLKNVLMIENNYNIDALELSDIYEENYELDETVFEYLEDNFNASDINYNLLDQLTDNEFNSVYEKLLDKKIL